MDSIVMRVAAGFAMAFGESGLGLGMFIPGETVVVVLAATMPSPPAMIALGIAVALGACAGDHVGYGLGRRYGDRMIDSRVVARLGKRHFERATDLLYHHGGRAVFLTRLVPIVRTLTPAAAGVSNLPYRRFLLASLSGSVLWAVVFVGGGSAAAAAADWAEGVLGRAAWLVAVIIVLAVVPPLLVRHVMGGRATRSAPNVEQYEHQRSYHTRGATPTALLGEFRIASKDDQLPGASQAALPTR